MCTSLACLVNVVTRLLVFFCFVSIVLLFSVFVPFPAKKAGPLQFTLHRPKILDFFTQKACHACTKGKVVELLCVSL